jgi:hypothetical protein
MAANAGVGGERGDAVCRIRRRARERARREDGRASFPRSAWIEAVTDNAHAL